MHLRFTPIKNYVSTAEAVINHAGLRAAIKPVRTKPFDADTDLPNENPLGTVPTLVLEDGESLFGGLVLYEYVDSIGNGPSLYAKTGKARFTMLRQAWMADGLFDSFVKLIIEGWEKKESHRAAYVARTWSKVVRCLDWFERDAPGFSRELDIAQVRAVGAISFVELKMGLVGEAIDSIDPKYDWRTGRPNLARWYDGVKSKPCFTQPLIPWDQI
jgi:glutathione S-transferase